MKPRAIFVACLLVFASAAHAEETPDDDCDNPQAQIQMTMCAGQAYERESAALDEAVRAFGAALEPATRVKLDEAQTQWQAFVEAHCRFIGSEQAEGGSMEPMIVNMCLTEHAKSRRAFLEQYNDGDPNDVD